jgi:peptidoglycan/xylan/chitin deacetylase (PgdA/CDA1 family)
MKLARIALADRPPWLPGASELSLPVRAGETRARLAAADCDLGFVLEERWRDPRPPLSARLPFHYHRLPARARRLAARALLGRRRPGPFPREPIERAVDAIRWARGERAHWPDGRRAALLLTHDVDTAAGAARIGSVAELSRALGVRATFFVCSHHYPLDTDALARLEQAGFEIASHGYDHDNRLAFRPEAERRQRLDAIAARFRPRIALAGFRSPSLLRTPELFASLAGRFAWDSSIPDVDLENGGGCGTVLPFRIADLVEIPVTLPMESSLLYRGERPAVVFERWTEKLAWIRDVGGVAVAVLHTEPTLGGHPELLRLYADWVAKAPPDVWITTPSELLRWLEAERLLAPTRESRTEETAG